jgi:hypothetical protein
MAADLSITLTVLDLEAIDVTLFSVNEFVGVSALTIINLEAPNLVNANIISSSEVIGGGATGGLTGYPIASNVRNGISYGPSNEYTGTVVLPGVSNVRTGIGYGAGGTEYSGTITLPAVSNVRTAISYGAGGSEYTGNIILPSVGDVKTGIGYGSNGTEYTGTYVAITSTRPSTGLIYPRQDK